MSEVLSQSQTLGQGHLGSPWVLLSLLSPSGLRNAQGQMPGPLFPLVTLVYVLLGHFKILRILFCLFLQIFGRT